MKRACARASCAAFGNPPAEDEERNGLPLNELPGDVLANDAPEKRLLGQPHSFRFLFQ